MAETTLEEALRCPKCSLPGQDTSQVPSTDSKGKPCKIHIVYCRNDRCSWLNTNWIVQENEDGTIPTQGTGEMSPKKFPKFSPEMETNIRARIEQQVRDETQPGGGEVTNPNG